MESGRSATILQRVRSSALPGPTLKIWRHRGQCRYFGPPRTLQHAHCSQNRYGLAPSNTKKHMWIGSGTTGRLPLGVSKVETDLHDISHGLRPRRRLLDPPATMIRIMQIKQSLIFATRCRLFERRTLADSHHADWRVENNSTGRRTAWPRSPQKQNCVSHFGHRMY